MVSCLHRGAAKSRDRRVPRRAPNHVFVEPRSRLDTGHRRRPSPRARCHCALRISGCVPARRGDEAMALRSAALHPFDLATNKLLVLVGPREPRDWIDVLGCCVGRRSRELPPWTNLGRLAGSSPKKRGARRRPLSTPRGSLAQPVARVSSRRRIAVHFGSSAPAGTSARVTVRALPRPTSTNRLSAFAGATSGPRSANPTRIAAPA